MATGAKRVEVGVFTYKGYTLTKEYTKKWPANDKLKTYAPSKSALMEKLDILIKFAKLRNK